METGFKDMELQLGWQASRIAFTKYVVAAVGDTTIEAPESITVPAQLPVLHAHCAPVFRAPPVSESVVGLPAQALVPVEEEILAGSAPLLVQAHPLVRVKVMEVLFGQESPRALT
jgi:hypothetical protein